MMPSSGCLVCPDGGSAGFSCRFKLKAARVGNRRQVAAKSPVFLHFSFVQTGASPLFYFFPFYISSSAHLLYLLS